MSKWDGIFRCAELGVDDCVVWWDALAATGALAGVLMTAVLGFFTYRLGVAANYASKAALDISKENHSVGENDRRREAHLILQFLRGEFVWTASRVERFYESLSDSVQGTLDSTSKCNTPQPRRVSAWESITVI